MVKRVTAKTFKKYFDAICPGEDGHKAYEKCMSFLRDKEVYPINDVIDMLRFPGFDNDVQYRNLVNQLLYSSASFAENGTFAQKRELRDMLNRGTFSKDLDAKSEKKYLKGQKYYVHDNLIRHVNDFGERYYVNEFTNEECYYPSVGTINGVGKVFDPTNWINSLKRKHPEWTMEEIQAEMDRIRDWGAERGTQMHDLIEDYLKDRWKFAETYDESAYHNDVTNCFRKIYPYIKYEIDSTILMEAFTQIRLDNIIGIENAGVLGYPDHLGTQGSKVILNDWKSANKRKNRQDIPNYFWQVAAYAMMIKNQFGIQVDEARIVVAPVQGSLQIFTLDRDSIKRNLAEFLGYAQQYYKSKMLLEAIS